MLGMLVHATASWSGAIKYRFAVFHIQLFDMAVESIDLPVVNLSEACLKVDETRKEETAKLIKSLSEVGFCYVSGISGYDVDELFRWTQWFYHEVPERVKMDQLATKSFNQRHPNIYRGYFPLVPGQLSHKQGYDLGPVIKPGDVLPGEEGNPFTEETPRLRLPDKCKEVERFYEVMYLHRNLTHQTADLIMSLIAEAGGEDPDFFKPMFSSCPMHTFRPLRYPKRQEDIPDDAFLGDGRILSTPAHMDSGFLTLLQTFDYRGLEIQLDGRWFAVPPKKGSLVVNLGEQMTEMSNGRFKSTIHRVIDIGEDRYSIPFFYEPSFNTNINTKIPRSLLPPSSGALYPEDDTVVPFATFLLNKLPIYAEYAKICDHLPQWMRNRFLSGVKNKTCWASRHGIRIDGKARDHDLDLDQTEI